jgi:hypothetical protein
MSKAPPAKTATDTAPSSAATNGAWGFLGALVGVIGTVLVAYINKPVNADPILKATPTPTPVATTAPQFRPTDSSTLGQGRIRPKTTVVYHLPLEAAGVIDPYDYKLQLYVNGQEDNMYTTRPSPVGNTMQAIGFADVELPMMNCRITKVRLLAYAQDTVKRSWAISTDRAATPDVEVDLKKEQN